ncbi:hypothetical protein HKD21_08190 [Gluconobacter cerevisiae]|uniref:Type I restriction modification DNA specificity domain-containing protein n=1 Tax=Gluconobacter cerevisiae TaxID=1379734 RepID=A0ABR9YE71_9PROT|nr:restriction endonuclease subunit S [Gluconobacter cerevisiae]MBF0876828.1 hypothetical protein [Gluconobacter cerevisiae]
MSDLPRGWIKASGDDLFSSVRGVTYSKSDSSPTPGDGLVPILRANNIVGGGITTDDLVFVPAKCVSPEQNLQDGDLLIASSSGSRTVVGKAATARDDDRIYAFGAFCTVARPRTGDLGRWLAAYSRSRAYRHYVEKVALGISINNLRGSDLKAIPIPVAPLPEQRRIVTKIDSLTGKSRRARDHLDHIPRLVEKYKQAILAAAFRGDLTREFNESKRPNKAEVDICKKALCARINIRPWKNSNEISKVHEGAPERWLRCYVGDVVAHRSGVAFKSGDFTKTGTQVVRLGNLHNGIFDLNRSPVFLKNVDQYKAFGGEAGDVLVAQTGTRFKRDYGHFIVLKDDHRGILINQRIACLSPTELLNPDFLKLFSHLGAFKDHFFGHETGGVNQGNVGLAGIMDAPIALPSRLEQDVIVSRLHAAFSWIDRLASDARSSRKLVDCLDQSVLAKAFRGELVPQNLADEPASALLDRIRAERTAAPKTKRGRKKIT